ncbi:MAG: hypothetical protein JJE50_07350 [Actinomycetales bacterium]|nr:hypothetical protein [Actinomycetales bacterium]
MERAQTPSAHHRRLGRKHERTTVTSQDPDATTITELVDLAARGPGCGRGGPRRRAGRHRVRVHVRRGRSAQLVAELVAEISRTPRESDEGGPHDG